MNTLTENEFITMVISLAVVGCFFIIGLVKDDGVIHTALWCFRESTKRQWRDKDQSEKK